MMRCGCPAVIEVPAWARTDPTHGDAQHLQAPLNQVARKWVKGYNGGLVRHFGFGKIVWRS
jgi:hypothetical protein